MPPRPYRLRIKAREIARYASRASLSAQTAISLGKTRYARSSRSPIPGGETPLSRRIDILLSHLALKERIPSVSVMTFNGPVSNPSSGVNPNDSSKSLALRRAPFPSKYPYSLRSNTSCASQ